MYPCKDLNFFLMFCSISLSFLWRSRIIADSSYKFNWNQEIAAIIWSSWCNCEVSGFFKSCKFNEGWKICWSLRRFFRQILVGRNKIPAINSSSGWSLISSRLRWWWGINWLRSFPGYFWTRWQLIGWRKFGNSSSRSLVSELL